jgi:hypothetical protein
MSACHRRKLPLVRGWLGGAPRVAARAEEEPDVDDPMMKKIGSDDVGVGDDVVDNDDDRKQERRGEVVGCMRRRQKYCGGG